MSGEGSVFRRASDGAWIAQVSRGPRGSRKTWSRSARSKSEAQRRLQELRTELDRQAVTTSATAPVGRFLEQWVNDARNIRPTTRQGYRAVVVTHLEPTIGHIPIGELRPAHVERMLANLEPLMSAKSLRNVHAVLRRALNQAVRVGLVPINVASREYVDPPKVTLRDPEALTEAQVDALLAAAVDDRLEALFVVLADCGLRMGEALGLSWQDITSDEIRVELELTRCDGRYLRADPKTDRSRRVLPLTGRARDAIARHRQRVIDDGFVPTATGPVFTNMSGGPLNGSWVTHRFYRLCEQAGIDRRPPKILRATYSSRLYQRGVPDRTIADLMGHVRERTTQRHYISTTPEQRREAVGRLAG